MSWLRDLFCGKPEPEKPNVLGDIAELAKNFNGNDFQKIDPDEFKSLVEAEFGSHLTGIGDTSDHFYYVFPSSVKTQFNTIYKKYKPSYSAEVFDCDNFTLDYLCFLNRLAEAIPNAKYSFAAGICYGQFHWLSGYHRAMVIITDNKDVRLFEPQYLKTYYKESWDGNNFKIIYY